MSSRLVEIFGDKKLLNRIQKRLPYLFQLAESKSSRAGKIGMEVGSLRERIIVALLKQVVKEHRQRLREEKENEEIENALGGLNFD